MDIKLRTKSTNYLFSQSLAFDHERISTGISTDHQRIEAPQVGTPK